MLFGSPGKYFFTFKKHPFETPGNSMHVNSTSTSQLTPAPKKKDRTRVVGPRGVTMGGLSLNLVALIWVESS